MVPNLQQQAEADSFVFNFLSSIASTHVITLLSSTMLEKCQICAKKFRRGLWLSAHISKIHKMTADRYMSLCKAKAELREEAHAGTLIFLNNRPDPVSNMFDDNSSFEFGDSLVPTDSADDDASSARESAEKGGIKLSDNEEDKDLAVEVATKQKFDRTVYSLAGQTYKSKFEKSF